MCNYTTLVNSGQGYVIKCNNCDHIQVAFGTSVISFTRTEFLDYVSLVDDRYGCYSGCTRRDEKVVNVPTPVRNVATVLTVRELCSLRYLLTEGSRKLKQAELFTFSEN